MTETSTEVDDDGRAFVVKRARSADDTARLAHEARMLDLARHPGVVDLDRFEVGPSPDRVGCLRTVLAGTRTLASPGLGTELRLRALAAVAETVADLHALGLVHGRVVEHHIILGHGGRPVLSGLAGAGLAGDAGPDGEPLRPASDVAGLGAVLDRVIAAAPTGDARRRPRRVELRRLAEQATHAEPGRRPTARRFAAELERLCGPLRPAAHASAPGLSPDDRPAGPRPLDDIERLRATAPDEVAARRHSPWTLVAVGLAGLAGLALISAGIRALGSTPPRTTSSALASRGTAPATVGSDPAAQPLDGTAGPSLPADTTPPSSAAAPGSERGGELTVDGHRYAVGSPDDVVLIADWGCDGRSTAVVIRPSGDVFRFDDWATPGRDLVATPAGHWDDPAAVAVGTDAAGCAVLTSTGPLPTTTLDPDPGPGSSSTPAPAPAP